MAILGCPEVYEGLDSQVTLLLKSMRKASMFLSNTYLAHRILVFIAKRLDYFRWAIRDAMDRNVNDLGYLTADIDNVKSQVEVTRRWWYIVAEDKPVELRKVLQDTAATIRVVAGMTEVNPTPREETARTQSFVSRKLHLKLDPKAQCEPEGQQEAGEKKLAAVKETEDQSQSKSVYADNTPAPDDWKNVQDNEAGEAEEPHIDPEAESESMERETRADEPYQYCVLEEATLSASENEQMEDLEQTELEDKAGSDGAHKRLLRGSVRSDEKKRSNNAGSAQAPEHDATGAMWC